MARNNEIHCIEKIRNFFLKQNNLYISKNNSNLFEIINILNECKPNENPNVFPDFLCEHSLVEHFNVSPYKEDRKGSQICIDRYQFRKYIEEETNKRSNVIPTNEYEINTFSFYSNDSKYDFFISSFRKNYLHHIESLSKYELNGRKTVFLIEQLGATLCVYNEDKTVRLYNISEDLNVLKIIKNETLKPNYILFNSSNSIEIIDTTKLEQMIANANENLDVFGGNYKETLIQIIR